MHIRKHWPFNFLYDALFVDILYREHIKRACIAIFKEFVLKTQISP